MKSQVIVTVVVNDEGAYARAKIGTKNVVIRPDVSRTGGLNTYATVDSAQRAFRKYAEKHGISNYVYKTIYR